MFVEWSPKLNGRRGIMIPADQLEDFCNRYDPGLRSYFQFDEYAAAFMSTNNSSKGMKLFPCGADKVFIDVDNVSYEDSLEIDLKLEKYQYLKYFSGSKGYHWELPCNWLYGVHTAYSHKMAVTALDITCDMCLYHPSRIISLPGRIHHKTGIRKHLVRINHGQNFHVELCEAPPVEIKDFLVSDKECLGLGMDHLAKITITPPDRGFRYQNLWSCSVSLLRGGLSYNTVINLIKEVNNTWNPPSGSAERAVQDASRYLKLNQE